MTVVNPKSISGITSITTASGSDDLLTIHTNNGTERLRVDTTQTSITGTTKIVTGIVTTLTATTGIVTTLTANTVTSLGAMTGSTNITIGGDIIHSGDDTKIRFPENDTITFETAATERLRIHTNGNVGIGTIVPSNMLHIHGSTMASMQFTDAGGGTDTKHWVNVANGTDFYWQAMNDAGSGGGNFFKFLRSGNEIQSFEGLQSGATWLTITNQHKQVRLSDSSELKLGSDLDMKLLHNNTDGVIENATGNLYVQNDSSATSEKIYIRAKADEDSITCEANGAVHLHHDGASTSSIYSRFDGATIRNNDASGVKHCNVDLFAETGGDANLYFYPDNASNNNHKFRINASDGEVIRVQGYLTGSYTDFIQCSYSVNNAANLKVKV